MRVYAIGVSKDKTLQWFMNQATGSGVEVVFLDLHACLDSPWSFPVPAGEDAVPLIGDLRLDPRGRYYNRLVDLSNVLPERSGASWRSMVLGLCSYLESVEGRVVNRPGTHVHNAAKPFHEWWLASRGLAVPASITSSSKQEIKEFLRLNPGGILKSLCGMRGTAQAVEAVDFDEFMPEQGPVHVQRIIRGYDVRVHVVGTAVHAEKITCEGIDYREKDTPSTHTQTVIPETLSRRLVDLGREMGLAFAGWDFKVDEAGKYWCLEANPMPGYDAYDRRADGAITQSLIRYLKHDN